MKNDNKFKDSVIKILAVVGAVFVLSFGGFITVRILSNIPEAVSGLTAQVLNITQRFISAEKIVVNLGKDTFKNGDLVELTFEHISKEEDGSYSFFYECRSGVHFERTESKEIIFCNTPYNFVNDNNSVSFTVYSTQNSSINVPLSINFVKNNSDKISKRGETNLRIEPDVASTDGGTILVTDNNSGNTATNTPRKPGTKIEETSLFNETSGTKPGTGSGVSDPNGVVDLKPTILQVGMIDKVTNVFTATSTINQGSRGAVRFIVENVGTKVSPEWTFNVVLPTFPSFIYHSKSQQVLYPGDRIEYTIGFDSIRNDNIPNTITVNADPISSIKESNETNNIVSTTLPAYSTK